MLLNKRFLLLALASTSISIAPELCLANFKYIPPSSSAGNGTDVPMNPGVNLQQAPTQAVPPANSNAPIARTALQGSGLPSTGEVIDGFGKKVPLVMALRQIAPASYQFAFAPGIRLGQLVSWNGGRPWPEVVQSVISPLGLTATEQNGVIYIDNQSGSGSAAR